MAVVQYQPKRRGSTVSARPLKAKENQSQPPPPVIEGLIGDSDLWRQVIVAVLAAGKRHSPVLIIGEAGTGKELIAQAIHRYGNRASKPFVETNCAGVPLSLFEAEFFGHERGAYTDARSARAGLFEQAHEGTLFLDEIGELSFEAQPKLLRVLECRKVKRLGGRSSINVDFRLIAATNRNLPQEVANKRFRRDLLDRLSGTVIFVPPLRQRLEDILLLARYFLKISSDEYGFSSPPGLEDGVLDLIRAYHWPGNAREMKNVFRRLVDNAGDGGAVTRRQAEHEIFIMERLERSMGWNGVIAGVEICGETIIKSENPLIGIVLAAMRNLKFYGKSLSELFDILLLESYRTALNLSGGNHAQAAFLLGTEPTALSHRIARAQRRTTDHRR